MLCWVTNVISVALFLRQCVRGKANRDNISNIQSCFSHDSVGNMLLAKMPRQFIAVSSHMYVTFG